MGPPSCTYRLNWARRTSWGWWDERDDTDLRTQNSKFEPWLSEKWNESGFRSPLCTYRLNWPGKPPEDGEMIEMALSSRHRIRNSSPGGLRPSTLPLGQRGSPQYWIFTSERGRNCFFLMFFWMSERGSNPWSPTFKGGSFNHRDIEARAMFSTRGINIPDSQICGCK